jgi:hypothetical protein
LPSGGFPVVLDPDEAAADNESMNIPGRVENGVVVLEASARLPEGARVMVSYAAEARVRTAAVQRPVVLPIFSYDGPPDIELTNDRIADALDIEDASA